MIEVKRTKKFGRGVFATQAIKKETEIERAPLIVLDKKDTDMVRDSNVLVYYDFSFNDKYSAIAGGFGSFYNHSTEPNVDWEVDQESEEIKYWTTRAIKKGEQLFINYGYDADEYFTVEKFRGRKIAFFLTPPFPDPATIRDTLGSNPHRNGRPIRR